MQVTKPDNIRNCYIVRRQRGRVVSVSDSQFGGLGFESRSDHYLDLFLGSPEFKSSATLGNGLLVCLWPVGILKGALSRYLATLQKARSCLRIN